MGILSREESIEPRQRLAPGTFRRIDDPDVDCNDCRLAVLHIGARIRAGEDRRLLLKVADRWLDLYARLPLEAALREPS